MVEKLGKRAQLHADKDITDQALKDRLVIEGLMTREERELFRSRFASDEVNQRTKEIAARVSDVLYSRYLANPNARLIENPFVPNWSKVYKPIAYFKTPVATRPLQDMFFPNGRVHRASLT